MIFAKKIAAVLLAGAGIVLLAGCGDKNITPPEGSQAAEKQNPAAAAPLPQQSSPATGKVEVQPAPAGAKSNTPKASQPATSPDAPAGQDTPAAPQAAGEEKPAPLSAEEARQNFIRSAQAGGVQVEAVWLTPEFIASTGTGADLAPEKGQVVILLTMTTHSGDLLGYDLGKNSVLTSGGKDLQPASGEWTAKDSHHPEAVLRFDADGPAEGLQLTLRDLRGSDLTLSW